MSEDKRALAGSFEITNNLSDRRGLKINGYLYSDDDRAEMNKRIDMAMDVIDRQVVRADIVSKRAQISAQKQHLDIVHESYKELMDRQKSGRNLTSQEKLQIKNFDPTVHNIKMTVESLEAAINAAEKKLAEEMGQ